MKKVLIIILTIIVCILIAFIAKVFFFDNNHCGVTGCDGRVVVPDPCIQDVKGNCI
jgi:uncharacterized alpha/beta hydrolase family protein